MPRASLLVVVPFAVVVGCGSSSGDDEGATSASEVTTQSDAGSDAAVDPCTPCSQRYASGAATYEKARRGCFCADDVCHAACAGTQCLRGTSKPADETCSACINDSYSTCVQVVEAACEADPECTRYVLCKVPESCKK